MTLVSEETSSISWFHVPDPIGRDNRGRDVDEVFPSWLQLNALVPHSWELCRSTNKEVEGIVLLVKVNAEEPEGDDTFGI